MHDSVPIAFLNIPNKKEPPDSKIEFLRYVSKC